MVLLHMDLTSAVTHGTEVNSILSMGQIIMAKAAGGPKAPKQRGHWDDDDAPEKFDTHH